MKTISARGSRRTTPAVRTRVRKPRKPAKTKVIDLVPAVMKIRSLLVPMDFSPSSNKALIYALSFAEQFGAKVTLGAELIGRMRFLLGGHASDRP